MTRVHLKCAWWGLLAALLVARGTGWIGETVTLAAIGAISAGHEAAEQMGDPE